ncbi:hypothetical protein Tco_1397848, partial [Tanacetum coccineum]
SDDPHVVLDSLGVLCVKDNGNHHRTHPCSVNQYSRALPDPRLFYGSRFGSRFGPVDDDDDSSPVEEMSPVKAKKPSKRASRAKKNDGKEKEAPKDWTKAEEIALCQAWCDVSENSEKRNSMKAKGFWEAVINYFEKEIGSTRGYDSILSK